MKTAVRTVASGRAPATCPRPLVPLPRAVAARSAKEDAVKQLEQFSAGVRSSLGQTEVSLTPPSDASSDVSVSSKDAEGLLELNKDTFDSYLAQQGDTLTVVDFFTDWCGPCKLMYPELVKLSVEMPDVRFVKFNCNKQNKDLGIKLGIKVAPTFHLYRNRVKVADMTGAKLDKLISLIKEQQAVVNN